MMPKSTVCYWLGRIHRESSTDDFLVSIQHQGERRIIGLKTGDRREAARRARDCYFQLQVHGWPVSVRAYNPTIGQYFQEVSKTGIIEESTLRLYKKNLRTVVTHILRLDSPHGGPHPKALRWREKVHSTPLSVLNRDSIEAWRKRYLKERGQTPESLLRAKYYLNNVRVNCRCMFTEAIKRELGIEDPFYGIKPYKLGARKYQSKIDAQHVLDSAFRDLYPTQSYLFIALGLLAGLRKAETDHLLWDQVDFLKSTVTIRSTKYYAPKSPSSTGSVMIPRELTEILGIYRSRSNSIFVIGGPAHDNSDGHRCRRVSNRAIYWLRAYEDSSGNCPLAEVRAPIHTLRKELGAIVTSRHGIFAAQQILRHSDIKTTSHYYADYKAQITTGLSLPPLSPGRETSTLD